MEPATIRPHPPALALLGLARLLRTSRLAPLDLEPALLAEARARLDAEGVAAELVPGDVRRMPFPDAAFDLVVDFGTCPGNPPAASSAIGRRCGGARGAVVEPPYPPCGRASG